MLQVQKFSSHQRVVPQVPPLVAGSNVIPAAKGMIIKDCSRSKQSSLHFTGCAIDFSIPVPWDWLSRNSLAQFFFFFLRSFSSSTLPGHLLWWKGSWWQTNLFQIFSVSTDRWSAPPNWCLQQLDANTSTLYLSCIVVPNINTSTANMHDAHTWYASEKSRKAANASAGVYNLRSDPPAHKSTPPSPAFHTIGKPGRGSHQGQIKFAQHQNSYHQPFLGRVGEVSTSKIGKKTRSGTAFLLSSPPIQVCFAHIWKIKQLLSVRAVLFPHLGPRCGIWSSQAWVSLI